MASDNNKLTAVPVRMDDVNGLGALELNAALIT